MYSKQWPFISSHNHKILAFPYGSLILAMSLVRVAYVHQKN